MKKYFFISIYFLFAALCFGQAIPVDSLYLGQTPPGSTPKIFQLPVNGGLFAAERIAISPDSKEIYYSEVNTYPPSTLRIKYFRYSNNRWNGPFNMFEGYMAPGLSLSGDTLFFQKNQSGVGTPYTYFSVRDGTAWSNPTKFMAANQNYIHYLQITNSGNYYLSSNPAGSIGGLDWCRLVINNTDTTIQSLCLPLNTSSNDADFYIAKDESFIITPINNSSGRPMFISYRKNDGSWTNPKRLGSSVNIHDYHWGTYVSPDNKFLFFTTGTKFDYSDTYVHWVRIDNMIDSLKHTNFIPYVKNTIPNQTAIKDSSFEYQIPDSTFIDDDGNNTLSYTTAALPSWLSFNSATQTFSGTPTATKVSTISVTATDTARASISCTFRVTIKNSTGIEEDKNQLPKEFALQQNYPNPFNPSTNITFNLPSKSFVSLKIFDLTGREVATLVSEELSAGGYSRQWNATGLPSGTYFYRLQTGSFNETKKLILLR